MLLQENKPIAFYSYTLNSAERNYPTGEQELLKLLAVVKILGNWRYYLEGCKALTVVTGHKSNTYLDTKPSTQL